MRTFMLLFYFFTARHVKCIARYRLCCRAVSVGYVQVWDVLKSFFSLSHYRAFYTLQKRLGPTVKNVDECSWIFGDGLVFLAFSQGYNQKSRRYFEFQLALKATVEPKQFCNYANSVLKTRSKIPELYVNAGKHLTTSDHDESWDFV